MEYQVIVKHKVSKYINKLATKDKSRIEEALRLLQYEPRPIGVRKMVTRNAYRIRVGDYRIVYEIRDKILWLL